MTGSITNFKTFFILNLGSFHSPNFIMRDVHNLSYNINILQNYKNERDVNLFNTSQVGKPFYEVEDYEHNCNFL